MMLLKAILPYDLFYLFAPRSVVVLTLPDFGWLIWAIPSNLIMQRSPPAYYLAFNIFMWGALLMCQAASQNFATLAVLRVLSGAFEAIADPAFMLFTSMFYTRAEQPSRISCWYMFNGVGVAVGGLIGYGIGRFICSALLLLSSFRPHATHFHVES